MEQLKIFESNEFGQVRTLKVDGIPYFRLNDICRALDLGNPSQAKTRLSEDGIIINEVIDSLGRKQQANFINESNMYKLIFQSRKESAERFTEWVTSEVLPSIRKTGVYKQPTSAFEMMELQFQALKEVKADVDSVNKDLQAFKQDLPLLGCEMDRITTAVKKMGVECLAGKDSNAYHDKSLRGTVYTDIYEQLKRQFGVSTYKSIKRNQCELAIQIIYRYQLPMILKDEINNYNAQESFVEV